MLHRTLAMVALLPLFFFCPLVKGQQNGLSNTASGPDSALHSQAASAFTQPATDTDSSIVSLTNRTIAASQKSQDASQAGQAGEGSAGNSEGAAAAPQQDARSSNDAFKPNGSSIPCSVIGYQLSSNKPMINLLCPAAQISAPLRVYLKLAWKDLGDVSHVLGEKLVKIGSSANLKSKHGQSKVELTYQNGEQGSSRKQWFDVNVLSVGLAKDGDYR